MLNFFPSKQKVFYCSMAEFFQQNSVFFNQMWSFFNENLKTPSDTIKKSIKFQVSTSRTHTSGVAQARSSAKYGYHRQSVRPSGRQALFTIQSLHWRISRRTYLPIIHTILMAVATKMPTVPPQPSIVTAKNTQTRMNWQRSSLRSPHTPAKPNLVWWQEVKKSF